MTNTQNDKLGTIKISDDVINVCVANTVQKIPGVNQLSTGLTNKGIKLSRNDEGMSIDIYVIVEYQVKIPQLAWDMQSKIKEEIESVTNEKVLGVNIHVQGVNLPGEENKND